MRSPSRRVATLWSLSRALKGEPVGRRTGPWARPVDWEELVALALELKVAPALWCAVQAANEPPAPVGEELERHYRLNTVRNLRFRHQLTEVVRCLNSAGVVPLLMKGALQIVNGTARRLGDRWMDDLDLVLPPGRMSDAVEALREMGYRPAPGKPFMHKHELPLVLGRAPGWIELHLELGSSPIPELLPAAEVWSRSSPLSFSALRARAPCPTDQVLHNILHSAVQDLNHAVAALPLRQLFTLSRLADVYGPEVQWKSIRGRMDDHGLSSEMTDHLWLAHRLAGMPLPEPGRAQVGARLHEARVMASFGLRWPPEVHRNLRFALGRDYLDSLYSHDGHALELARARARHVCHVLYRDGARALQEVLERKV